LRECDVAVVFFWPVHDVRLSLEVARDGGRGGVEAGRRAERGRISILQQGHADDRRTPICCSVTQFLGSHMRHLQEPSRLPAESGSSLSSTCWCGSSFVLSGVLHDLLITSTVKGVLLTARIFVFPFFVGSHGLHGLAVATAFCTFFAFRCVGREREDSVSFFRLLWRGGGSASVVGGTTPVFALGVVQRSSC